MSRSVLARFGAEAIAWDPFPHVVVEDALDPAWYRELEESFPSLERIVGPRPWKSNKAYFLSARDVLAAPDMPEAWREFFAHHVSREFLRELLRFWEACLRRVNPHLEAQFGKPQAELSSGIRHPGRHGCAGNLEHDVMLDCQFGVNAPVTRPSSVRVPHVDDPTKPFAGLIYFRAPGDESTGGDLQLYRVKSPRFHHDLHLDVEPDRIEVCRTIPYRPNTLVMWANSERSIHGVSPRSVTLVPRRYLNFISECYRLTTPGFFCPRYRLRDRARQAVRRFVSRAP